MNLRLILSILLLLVNGQIKAQSPAAPVGKTADASAEIASLQAVYKTATERFDVERDKALAALEASYTAALERLQTERSSAGDLDGAVAVKAERERILAHTETAVNDIKAMSPAMRRLRDKYDSTAKSIAEDHTRRMTPAARKYYNDLEALQVAITKRGDVDGALLVKVERERFVAAMASSTPTVGGPPGAPSQPAPGKNDPAVVAALLGTWRWTNKDNGWSGTRVFKPDGTLLAEEHKNPGKWWVESDRVVLEYDQGKKEYMPLPLDPANGKAQISRGRTILAVKEPDSVSPKKPAAAAEIAVPAAPDASTTAVVALVSNSHWLWYDNRKAPGKAEWHEFYKSGAARNSWGRTPTWDIVPPNILHIYDAYDNRHFYFDVDVAKRTGSSDPQRDKNDLNIKFEKRALQSSSNKK